jgi:Rrf2 family transcriptional regulator, iron-sulfur cluster assembly transcription factor
MFFSRTCEYAIKIMIYLKAEHKDGKWHGVREIAQAIDSPEPFTSKILQQLVKAGLLNSMRGPSGGFHLNDAESKLNLLDVVKAIDGDGIIKKCVLGFHECSADRPCAVHDELVVVRDHLASILSNTSVKKIADGVKNNRETLT